MNRIDRIKGCLLGGAVGDALGASVELREWSAIRATSGAQGIVDYAPAYGRLGAITDDTQMMLFTAEGLLRAYVRGSHRVAATFQGVIHHASALADNAGLFAGHPRQSRWLVATRARIVVSPCAR